MHYLGWSKHLAAEVAWANKNLKKSCVIWCKIWKEQHPNPEDWMNVAWTDKFHFPIMSIAKTKHVMQRKGEHLNPECTQKVARMTAIRKKQIKEY